MNVKYTLHQLERLNFMKKYDIYLQNEIKIL